MKTKNNIHHIVVDGGPCGGKTTILAYSFRELEEKGFLVFVVPEAATLLINSGISPANIGPFEFQKSILKLQKNNEIFWKNKVEEFMQKYEKDAIIFYDRACLTGMAYLGTENDEISFQGLTREILNLGIEDLRAEYDAVVHLVTAADGAEEFYTLENNAARTETPEEARILDKRTQDVWIGHRHLRVIPNMHENKKISFEQKKKRFLDEVLCVVGYPKPIELEDKYLLGVFNVQQIPLSHRCINITQTYLVNNISKTEERVRRRHSLGVYTYYHTLKKTLSGLTGRVEIERKISLSEYNILLQRVDKGRGVIIKDRYCFLYQNQYFEVDIFRGGLAGLILCERERTHLNDKTLLPDFLDIKEDVTNNPNYKNSNLALRA